MNIYFSGVGGVGIGPLTEIAHDAGHSVIGSDLAESLLTEELRGKGIAINIGQDGTFLRACHEDTPFDWFVYTSALLEDHPELVAAKELGIRTGKRDEFLAEFIKEHDLKLIAVSGTHGKTTTTGMAVWAFKELGVPVSYSIGTTVSFGSSGAFVPGSEYFVYECDEYDRNMLHFQPYLSLLTSIDYDHPDTYPTEEEYKAAFRQYTDQSTQTIGWENDLSYISQPTGETVWALRNSEVVDLALTGEHNRRNATLILKGLEFLGLGNEDRNRDVLSRFPGTDRRFEKLAEDLYTDYGHHPEEIAATLQLAREISKSVVLVYQPHQNWRQHFIRDQYTNQFEAASEVYWLPTYLTRENPDQEILSPEELTKNLTNPEAVHYAQLDETLWQSVQLARQNGSLVLFMGAGSIDAWLRGQLGA